MEKRRPRHGRTGVRRGLTKPSNQPGFNDKNFQIVINQFYHGDSALSFYYYRGTNPFPDPNDKFTTATTKDTFQRAAIYGNYWPQKNKLDLLAAYAFGKDSLDDPTVTSRDGKYNGAKFGTRQGFMMEANYHVKPELCLGARYDEFVPTDKVDRNSQKAVSLFVNYRLWDGLQLITDFQHKIVDQQPGGSNTDDQFTARLIFI